MIVSGNVNTKDVDVGKLKNVLLEQPSENNITSKTGNRNITHTQNVLEEMSRIYDFCLVGRMDNTALEHSTYNRTEGNRKRPVKFSSSGVNKSLNSYVFTTKKGQQYSASVDAVSMTNQIVFGSIAKIYDHRWKGESYTWILLDVFQDQQYCDGFWSVSSNSVGQKPFLLKDVSVPQVIAKEDNRFYYVNTNIKLLEEHVTI